MTESFSFTHLDPSGGAQMVDVSTKTSTSREAIATALVQTTPEVIRHIEQALVKKGDVLAVARVAGIMAAKKTSELIPLCHPLALTKVTIDFTLDATLGRIALSASCRVTGPTGVEMEALTAVSVAALTIHDMCKALDPRLTINQIQLQQKTGGKSGLWHRESNTGADSND
ncbi:cyclic pyranopterin monophosphate synthase MoaC [Rheinheimera riviphila]|uniref:Cyclic pyranopterin monophosphate synthase n=1 Tax=Rheinheimera riviphila TaxID=1834037 RepID=A0A437QBX3_9GAMM|nr:cyclic pyranopterin monophosphate synthase MoaC [Rheinheimera riviphila]RVU31909.1 cyclic pyranopterin monophosphate synthase MoaC [Rheinheimera riviphila]